MKSTQQIYNDYVEGEEAVVKDTSCHVQWREKCADFLLSVELSFQSYVGLSSSTAVHAPPHSNGKRKSHKDDVGYDEEASKILIIICQDPFVQLTNLASLLTKFRADPNCHSMTDGRTVLHYLVANRSWSCCRFLIRAGADCSAVDFVQQSVLSLLCAGKFGDGQERLLRMMLEVMSYRHGNKIREIIDQRDAHGRCALDYAVGHKNYVAIKQLLLRGSSVLDNDSYNELKQLYGSKLVPVEECIDYKCPDWKLKHYYPIRFDRSTICYRLLMFRYYEEVRSVRPRMIKRVAISTSMLSDRVGKVIDRSHESTAPIHNRRQDMRSKNRLRQVTRLGSVALDEYQQEMDDKLQHIKSRLDREYFVSFHGLFG